MSQNSESELQRAKPEFDESFPDEAACHKALTLIFNAPDCERCGCDEYNDTLNPRISECRNCSRKRRVYCDTLFARVRLIREWFAALWFTTKGIVFSAYEFARIFGIALSTAQNIVKTIGLFLIDRMEGLPTVSSEIFLELFCRRSSLTPANSHPQEEQAAQKNEARTHAQDLSLNDLTELQTLLCKILKVDTYLTIDNLLEITNASLGELLMELTSLQFRGIVECNISNAFRLVKRRSTGSLQEGASNPCILPFLEKTKIVWQRFSRKYLQLYLALYWSSLNKDIWTPALLKDFCSIEPPKRSAILAYNSPDLVCVPNPKEEQAA